MTNNSMGNFVTDWLATQQKVWGHDRSATIGASEIGQCARRVWFVKNDAPRDEGFVDSRGAAQRGDLIEKHVWAPAMRLWAETYGHQIHFIGDEQVSLSDGFLSATSDAIVTMKDGEQVLRECKSIDPRVNLDDAKMEHIAQVQVQLGVVTNAGQFKPSHGIIDYIDASFVDRVTSFTVQRDPSVYAAAKARALKIMDAYDPLSLRPEGKMAGGKECDVCAWSSHCASVQVAGIPSAQDQPLSDNLAGAFNAALERYAVADAAGDEAKAAKAEASEEIKEILRAHGARRTGTGMGSVSWTSVKGRVSPDLKAAAEAGIDLTPFNREGNPSERLTVKLAASEEPTHQKTKELTS